MKNGEKIGSVNFLTLLFLTQLENKLSAHNFPLYLLL